VPTPFAQGEGLSSTVEVFRRRGLIRPPTTIENHGSWAKVPEGDTQLRGSCPVESEKSDQPQKSD
jgi:hypothetical protein